MTAFTASPALRDWTTALTGKPEPPTLVLNEPSTYHFRALDPRLPLRAQPPAAWAFVLSEMTSSRTRLVNEQ